MNTAQPPTALANHIAAQTAATPATPTTDNFFIAVLNKLGIAATPGALQALDSVAHYEGQNNYYNPLNVVQKEPGSTSFNDVGVQRFPNFNTGVQGTVDLFTNNSVWNGVLAALKTGNATSSLNAFDQVYDRWSPGTHIPLLQGTSATATGSRSVGAAGGSVGAPTGNNAVNAISIPNPLAWPGELAGDAAGAVASQVEGWVMDLVKPVLSFLENSALVIFGATLLIIGLVVLARQASNSGSSSSAPASSSPVASSAPTREAVPAEDAAALA